MERHGNRKRSGVQAPARVAVYQSAGSGRSEMIAHAMLAGLKRSGEPARLFNSTESGVVAEVAVFYGFGPELRRIFAEYRAAGKTVVCVDLGFWGRNEGGRRSGYHKVTVNSRHPNAYFQNRRHDASRVARFGIKIRPWHEGRAILVAGMSGKSAGVEGFGSSEWESKAVAELRRHTKRKIIYRPKPSWREATPIAGTEFSPGLDGLNEVLAGCHAVVTHHSNVGVDALCAGTPVFCMEGAALPLALRDLALIETPRCPEGREQLLADLAWCQWTPAEMRDGLCWKYLRDEGLVS